MKRSQFAFALLAAFAAASHSVSLACDQCKATCVKCASCVQCDDSGLLDVVDRVAGRMQRSIEQSLPKVRATACDCRHTSAPCDDKPQHKKLCDCEARAGAANVHNPHSNLIAPSPLPPHSDYDVAPLPHQHVPEISAPVPVPIPVPTSVPSESNAPPTNALPDRAVDPFKDDTVNRVRRVPASPVQYQHPASRYAERYDPQALNRYRVRLSDEATLATSDFGATSVTGATSDTGFQAGQSSRRATNERPMLAQANGSAVIPASSTSRLQPIRSAKAERLPSRAESLAIEGTYPPNPLRSND